MIACLQRFWDTTKLIWTTKLVTLIALSCFGSLLLNVLSLLQIMSFGNCSDKRNW